jgi:hypothetical protein
MTALAQKMGLSQSTVSISAKRGEKIAMDNGLKLIGQENVIKNRRPQETQLNSKRKFP